MKNVIVYLNGRYLKKSDAKVSFLDHGLLYGDGVFETLRAYNKKIFRPDEHFKRLHNSAKKIYLKIPLNSIKLNYIIYKLIKLNNLRNAYIRVTVTRGPGEPGINPGLCKSPTQAVYVKEFKGYTDGIYSKGVDAVTVSTMKNHPEAINPSIKSCNFLNNIIAGIEAKSKNAFEGIMLSREGWVAEGCVSNIFISAGNTLLTPPPGVGALDGITRREVIELAAKSGIKVIEKKFKKNKLHESQECFLTNTLLEIMPVTRIDGKTIGNGKPGKFTKLMMKKYKELVKSEK